MTARDADQSDQVDASVTGVVLGAPTGRQTSANVLSMLTVTSGDIAADPSDGSNLAWAFDSGSQAFDFLAKDETLTLTYTVRATDSQSASDTHDVTVTITGTNDAPHISLTGADTAAAGVTETNAGLTAS